MSVFAAKGASIKLNQFVDLGVIRRNLKEIKALTGKSLLFMVKADAYGHGANAVARMTEDIVDIFGVATVQEGLALRTLGIEIPILSATANASEIDDALHAKLTLGVSSCAQLQNVIEHSEKLEIAPKIHIKLDTGMHRLGFEKDEIPCIVRLCKAYNVEIEGVYSHLRSLNEQQKRQFMDMYQDLNTAFPRIIKHLASSAALSREDMFFDMVRVGIAGYSGAMTVISEVLSARYVASGECISYGEFRLEKGCNTAIVFGGYADGIPRELPSGVVIRGRKCKVLGRICMDMFAVETDGFFAEVGEKVLLLGGLKPILEVAAERETIDYTVLTSFRGRTERIYFCDTSEQEEKCSDNFSNIK